jgi:hypothetical protein
LLFFASLVWFTGYANPAASGFLEELFGVGDSEQGRPRGGEASSKTTQYGQEGKDTRADYPPKLRRAPRKAVNRMNPTKPSLCDWSGKLENGVEKNDALLHDATLRSGDSVVTAQGVRVFHGPSECPHKLDEFLPLAAVNDLPKAKRDELVAAERAMRTPHDRNLTVSEENPVVSEDKHEPRQANP